MANIVIKDLTESIELDRKAMRSITGGSRFGARPAGPPGGTILRHRRLFSYPSGFDVGRPAAGHKNVG